MKIKLGCDPELFLADMHGALRASCGKIGGTKEHPQALVELGEGFAVQEDNVAIEFNIPPADSKRVFTDSIARAIKYLNDGVNSMLDYRLVMDVSAASFPPSELTSPAARVFGCDPDFDAWTHERNPKPHADDPNLRSCGGHVHVGYDKSTLGEAYLIRCMDMFLGVPSVLMDAGEDSALRRKLYGKPGAYRSKPYGVEYRTLSNFWIKDPRTTDWVWDSTVRALDAANAQFPVGKYKDAIHHAINNNDKGAAMELVKEHKLELVNV